MNSIRAAGPFGGPCSSNRIQMLRFGAVSNSKSSNGQKIARKARNLTIFGPNRSRRRELKFEKFSNERANEQTNKLYKTNWHFRFVFGSFSAGSPKPRPELSFWIIIVMMMMIIIIIIIFKKLFRRLHRGTQSGFLRFGCLHLVELLSSSGQEMLMANLFFDINKLAL